MLSRTEAERIASSVNALRPDWPVASLLTFLGKRKDQPMMPLALRLFYVALDPDTTSPARIDTNGPWQKLGLDERTQATPTPRRLSHVDCRECFRPEADHGIDPTLADHEYEPWLTTEAAAMPADLRAAIDAARNTPPPDSTTDESEQ